MICRRCERQLPEGETTVCPYCGIRQDTYIVPRTPERYKRPKMKRGAFLSILSVALVLFIVAMLIPFLRDYNKRGLLTKIESAYNRQDKETLNILYGKLQSSYPKASEEISSTKALLDELLGVTPSAAPPSGVPLDEWVEEAMLRDLQERVELTREQIFELSSIEIASPAALSEQNLEIAWKNLSSKNIVEIKFSAEGYDALGNAVLLSGSELSRASLRYDKTVAPGSEAVSTFLSLWPGRQVVSVKLLAVSIRYEDDSTKYIDEDVLDALIP